MATAPYFAPTYFPPAYFYAPADPASTPAAGPTPYDAPTYFPPAYFCGIGRAATTSTPSPGPTPYNAPTYFPPGYFYGVGQPSPASTPVTPTPPPATPTVPVAPSGLDGVAYAALLALLEATGEFDGVIFGDPTRRGQAGSGRYPLAVVSPRGWEEDDDYDPLSILRRVSFVIRVVVRAEDGPGPFGQLDRLAAVVQGVVDGSNLGGSCLPALTRISAGRYDGAANYPEWSVELLGEFASIVDPAAGTAATA